MLSNSSNSYVSPGPGLAASTKYMCGDGLALTIQVSAAMLAAILAGSCPYEHIITAKSYIAVGASVGDANPKQRPYFI